MEEAIFETWVTPRTFEYSASSQFMGVKTFVGELSCILCTCVLVLLCPLPISFQIPHHHHLGGCKIRGCEVASVLLVIFMHLVPCGYYLTRKGGNIFRNFLSNASFLESCITTWSAE
jgi:hypothetical protein